VAKTMPFLPPMTGNGVYHKNGCWLGDGLVWFIIVLQWF
jgi:hypothetical protein